MFEELEKYISSVMEERKLPGCSVAVVKDLEIIWSKGFGYANVEEQIPATPETVYRFCSITKPVVTVGLLQLMEKGKFRLDDPINDHLEAKIQTFFAEQPTIRDLLTHQTGLGRDAAPRMRGVKPISLEEFVERWGRAVRQPKKMYQYSNIGFTIVGYLLGLLSGEPYPVYMKENVLKPLEMDSSFFYLKPEMEKSLAQGYRRDGLEGSIQPVKPYGMGTIPPPASGSLFSTCVDLAHFVIAQLNGGVYKGRRILKEETLEEMHRLQVAAGNSRSGMGLTWNRFWYHGHVLLRHTCGTLGYTGHVAFYPDLKVGFVWNTNLNDGTGWRPPAPTALQIIAGEYKPFEPKTIKTETVPGEWREIAVTYGTPGQKRAIRIEDGLLVMGEGDNKIYLERIDDTRYLVHGGLSDGYEVTFEYDDKGRVKQFDLGNSVVPRYLIGYWRVKHTTVPLFFDMVLDIESETRATASGILYEKVAFTDFKVDEHRITGCLKIKPPQYQREYKVELELLYIGNQMIGQVIVTREGAQARGIGTPITFSRP